jgi:hypothetical protein
LTVGGLDGLDFHSTVLALVNSYRLFSHRRCGIFL